MAAGLLAWAMTARAGTLLAEPEMPQLRLLMREAWSYFYMGTAFGSIYKKPAATWASAIWARAVFFSEIGWGRGLHHHRQRLQPPL